MQRVWSISGILTLNLHKLLEKLGQGTRKEGWSQVVGLGKSECALLGHDMTVPSEPGGSTECMPANILHALCSVSHTFWRACQRETRGAALHEMTCPTCGELHLQALPECSGACTHPSAWTCCSGLFSAAAPPAGCLSQRASNSSLCLLLPPYSLEGLARCDLPDILAWKHRQNCPTVSTMAC